MKINSQSNVFTHNIKFMPLSREKTDLKFEKADTVELGGGDGNSLISRGDLLPETGNQEVTTPSDGTSYKKETSFKIDSGILQGATLKYNTSGGLSSPATLTILEEPSSDTMKPRITGKMVSSLLLQVPDTRQGTDYSCGASALQSVLLYWGEEYSEAELMEMLHTSPENGTHPDDMVRVAKDLGYEAELRENLTLEDLEKSVKEGIPVIVDGQAWREGDDLKKPWTEVWESGHYMVVIGLDKEKVYFEDPSLLGSRGEMPRQEFLDRWHDYEGDVPLDDKDKKYIHPGIFIKGKKPNPPPGIVHID